MGLAPDSNAVLQIWPPFCCSPIHNHGQAYGLIKVLNNQITVENYKNLNFLNQNPVPYQDKIFYQDRYTWLSEHAYGIHRLVNFTDETTLSLESYHGAKGSQQFFQMIQISKAEKDSFYGQYYPQNDWQNYLNLLNLDKATQQAVRLSIGSQYSVQNFNEDIKFIKRVRAYYLNQKIGINTQNPNLSISDHSFPGFAYVLRKQYDLIQASQIDMMDEEIEKIQKSTKIVQKKEEIKTKSGKKK